MAPLSSKTDMCFPRDNNNNNNSNNNNNNHNNNNDNNIRIEEKRNQMYPQKECENNLLTAKQILI